MPAPRNLSGLAHATGKPDRNNRLDLAKFQSGIRRLVTNQLRAYIRHIPEPAAVITTCQHDEKNLANSERG